MTNEFINWGDDKPGWTIYKPNEWTKWAKDHGIILEKQRVSRNRKRNAGSDVYLEIRVSHNVIDSSASSL